MGNFDEDEESRGWEGRERRQGLTEEKLRRMIEAANEKQEERLEALIREENARVMEFIESAFPGGDVAGHRIAHEKQIKRADRWEAMKADFITKAFTGGMYAAGLFILVLLWEWFKAEVRK